MPPQLTDLLTERDNSEVIRDEIAAILLIEQQNQRELAEEADEDPLRWALRVFVERANPWDAWIDAPAADSEAAIPIVNVWLETITYDRSKSDMVSRQQATATYNIDCYAYGVSEDTEEGHIPGDEMASIEVQRVIRLVRRILMSAHYISLGLPPTVVGGRFPQSIRIFQPQLENKGVQHVMAARLALEVTFNEFAPQHEGVPLELISVGVKRKETGELYFTAAYDVGVDS